MDGIGSKIEARGLSVPVFLIPFVRVLRRPASSSCVEVPVSFHGVCF